VVECIGWAWSSTSTTVLGVCECSVTMRNDAEKAQDDAVWGRAVAQTNFSPNSPHPYVMYSIYSTRLCVGVCDVCGGGCVSVYVTD